MPTNITLLELTDHVCKWPVSGEKADTRFCGAHAEPGKSYCKHHQGRSVSVVYTPLKGKRAANYGAWLSRIGTGKPASIDVAEFWEAANG